MDGLVCDVMSTNDTMPLCLTLSHTSNLVCDVMSTVGKISSLPYTLSHQRLQAKELSNAKMND